MRFTPDGPSIPDDLLVARDAGDVIFFCGAGVSRHRANLPDFLKLGGKVIDLLGAGEKSLARKLFTRIRDLEPIDGVGGLIATDRIFSLLEREFEQHDIHAAIAKAITPEAPVNLSAHQILLDLSRGRDGTVRLVTTNFDLLFEDCVPGILRWGPPELPNPRSARFEGIVHLHGKVDDDYAGPGDEAFVVSSADFGRAYLSEGWATRFMQALLARFQIVFVGYAADDPPVQYLLEALNLNAGNRSRLFAFQAGSNDDNAALWEHRGVRAIQFDDSQGFDTLWNSLDAWAVRARDVDGWYADLLARASAGPASLDPHVRGQIAHTLSTRDGARRVLNAEQPLPASWLLALDPRQRFDPPGPVDRYGDSDERIDPYAFLALDFDEPPLPVDPNEFRAERKIPEGSWDAFARSLFDQDDIQEVGFADFCGAAAPQAGALSPRLKNLSIWFTRVAHQPIALWWAAGCGPLHPEIADSVLAWIRQDPERWPDHIKLGWRRLIASWSDRRVESDRGYYDLDLRQKQEGWSATIVRDYAALFAPRLTVQRAYGLPHPLAWTDANPPEKLLAYDVEYPNPYDTLEIPDDYLGYAVEQFRGHLLLARSLEAELSGQNYIYLQTTRPDDGGEPIELDTHGITGQLAQYQRMLERLTKLDREKARAEIATWPTEDRYIFARLRIWAAGSPLTSPSEAAGILLRLDDETFWMDEHQRDLLYALRDRWEDFSARQKSQLERKLLKTSYPWSIAREDGGKMAAAHQRLDRLHWLHGQGVAFSFPVDAEFEKLRAAAGPWSERSGQEAADSNAPVVHSVGVNSDPSALRDAPLNEVLVRAREASKTDFRDYVERRPFAGLVEEKPVRAFAALSQAAKAGEVPQSFWAEFLQSERRAADSTRFVRAIIVRLATLSPAALGGIAYPVSEWLRVLGLRLFEGPEPLIDCIWGPMMAALGVRNDNRKRSVDSSWANDALNAPVGKLAELLFKFRSTKEWVPNEGLPAFWADKMAELLGLPGDMRRHALVMAGFRTNWLFAVDADWTTEHLLGVIDDAGDDGDALWDGILWAARAPSPVLYELLKPALLQRALSPARRRAESNVVAGFLLVGWSAGTEAEPEPQLVTTAELRDILVESDDDLRSQMLRHIENWSADPEGEWRARLLPFLTQVWPNHRALRTPKLSAWLVDLALSSGDLFPEVVTAILPRLVPIRGGMLRGFMLRGEQEDHPARRFPKPMLELLWAILAEDVALWPYRIEDILDLLAQEPEVQADPRLSELRRRRAG